MITSRFIPSILDFEYNENHKIMSLNPEANIDPEMTCQTHKQLNVDLCFQCAFHSVYHKYLHI